MFVPSDSGVEALRNFKGESGSPLQAVLPMEWSRNANGWGQSREEASRGNCGCHNVTNMLLCPLCCRCQSCGPSLAAVLLCPHGSGETSLIVSHGLCRKKDTTNFTPPHPHFQKPLDLRRDAEAKAMKEES